MLKSNYFRPEQPPSVDRPTVILFYAWFHHKIILAKLRPWAELAAQAPAGARKFPTFVCRATAGCCLAITVDECNDWLQHCLMHIHAF